MHPVIPTNEEFREAMDVMWGKGLEGRRLAEAKKRTREHFETLYLVEIELGPAGAGLDWSAITQPISGRPQDEWQVPFDEQPLDTEGKRWAFFLHFVDLHRPLKTPLGERTLPEPTPIPPHLQHVSYEVPG